MYLYVFFFSRENIYNLRLNIICADPPVWLKRLMSVCLLKPECPDHHHSIVFVSLETLLTLLDWQLLPHGPCPLPSSSTFGYSTVDTSSTMRSNFLSKCAVDHILLNVQFEKVLVCTCHVRVLTIE